MEPRLVWALRPGPLTDPALPASSGLFERFFTLPKVAKLGFRNAGLATLSNPRPKLDLKVWETNKKQQPGGRRSAAGWQGAVFYWFSLLFN